MTLFSIENLAQSDCKSTRCSPQPASQPDYGIFSHVDRDSSRPPSAESSFGAVSPNDGNSSGASSVSDSPPSTKKPPHSYIALIAMAILHTPEKRLLLCDIYEYIMKRFPFFKDNERSWRNSIRHNLSLNECFIKVGRSGDGRGHFWAIHPANFEDFARGDYRRRQARRRVRASAYSPYAYPTTFASPHHAGFVPMTYTPIDVIPKSQLAMLPGFHQLSAAPAPYHPAGPALITPSPIPAVSHSYLPTPAAIRPDFAGRLPIAAPRTVFSSPKPLSPPTTSSVGSYSHLYLSYSNASSLPSVLPTTSAWTPLGICPTLV